MVNNLHEQIAVLTDDIKFLREDSINKSYIIKSLLNIINGSQNKVSLNNDKSLDDFNDSTYNDHVDVYNDNISNYNNVIDGPDIGMQSTMINAHNKCIHDNFQTNDLRVTSLLDTTIEEQLRQCQIMSNNSITSNYTTLNSCTNGDTNYLSDESLIPTIDQQLRQCRTEKHNNYMNRSSNLPINTHGTSAIRSSGGIESNLSDTEIMIQYKESNAIYKKAINKNELWRQGTTLIIGDSVLYGIDESKLKDTKVRVLPGSSVEDIFFNITPLLRKKPTNIILHIGTNNAVYGNSNQIIDKLMKLKEYIMLKLPNCNLIFSSLINRVDDAKAQLTVTMTNNRLAHLDIRVINNNNINGKHLGRKGLHLNSHGTGKLAVNFIKVLKTL